MNTKVVKQVVLFIIIVFAIGVVMHIFNVGTFTNAYPIPTDANAPYQGEIDQTDPTPTDEPFDFSSYFLPPATPEPETTAEPDISATTAPVASTTPLVIDYIDTGNSDAILIYLNEKYYLIDAGNTDDSKTLTNYLVNKGIAKIDALILTHPHADHIGSASKIIKSFDVVKIYMPRIPDKYVPTTKTYTTLLETIAESKVPVKSPDVGDIIAEGDGFCFFFLNSVNTDNTWQKTDLNEYSLVTYLNFNGNNYIFAGDADKENEKIILDTWPDLDFDTIILKAGHHCSRTASSDEWLNELDPKIAVCTVSADNNYGHPHKETLDRFEERSIKVLRNDLDKTIELIDYGNHYEVKTNLPSADGSRQ